jgi:hypothetical protein
MAYIINKFSGGQLVVLEDGTLDTSTSLGLLGRNYTGYGEVQNENFVFLLENFANEDPPSRPITGQAWYNTSLGSLNVYNGTAWTPVGSATTSNTEPEGFDGALWYKDTTDQLFIFDSGFWKLIGPEAVEGFGATRIRARTILDNANIEHAVVEILVDGTTFVICADEPFTIDDSNLVTGFTSLQAGTNFSSNRPAIGPLVGNASSASRLEPGRRINGVFFDGQTDITIGSNTTNTLTRGTYLTGANFNGSAATTWSVDASSANVIGKIVARDSAGDFSAGTITADLVGNVSGNVTATTGTSRFIRVEANEFVGATLSGNAFSTTKLETARTINGVLFDGTANITVPANAETLTGDRLAVDIKYSNLISVGTLLTLRVSNYATFGPSLTENVTIGYSDATNPLLSNAGFVSTNTPSLILSTGGAGTGDALTLALWNSNKSLTEGGAAQPALVPLNATPQNIGHSNFKWNRVYANYFEGIATTAQYADLAEKYVADANYEAGTVLEFGGEFEVTLAEDGTARLAGVVSTDPAYLMNSKCVGKHTVALALQGRVPCKVRGKIQKGDMLMSGGGGYARKATNPQIGTIIGKALADFDGVSGVIEVAVGRV